jgi:hypothetical protein
LTPDCAYDSDSHYWINLDKVLGKLLPVGLFWFFPDSDKGAAMTHPESTPPLTGENLLMDDDNIIHLTDEIRPSEEDDDIIELRKIADCSETPEVQKFPDMAVDKSDFIDLCDVIEASDLRTERPPELPVTETEALNDGLILSQEISPLTVENEFVEPTQVSTSSTSDGPGTPDFEYQIDDLQQLIDEVVHDSQVPHQDLSGSHSEFNEPNEKDPAAHQDVMTFQADDRLDAAVERAIRDLVTERIGLILNEVVTIQVTKEIENLKNIILNYLTSGRPADKNKS